MVTASAVRLYLASSSAAGRPGDVGTLRPGPGGDCSSVSIRPRLARLPFWACHPEECLPPPAPVRGTPEAEAALRSGASWGAGPPPRPSVLLPPTPHHLVVEGGWAVDLRGTGLRAPGLLATMSLTHSAGVAALTPSSSPLLLLLLLLLPLLLWPCPRWLLSVLCCCFCNCS